ncbi:MAG TPA: ATP-binding protein [Mycobacteriales bacterium]|nr:ATP-binding protein [Mycobacteriales bacterium]
METDRGVARAGAGEVLALASLAAGMLLLPALGVAADTRRIGPIVLAGLGVALLWRQADDEARARWRARALARPSAYARTALGVALVAVGLAVFLAARGELRQAREGLLGTVVVVAGLALVTGPYWVRTARDLTAERRERIRAQERAELAAHVHDSVLHTLALIQRHAADPAAVTRLARAQERDLRGWLYRRAPDAGSLRAAVEGAAAEVEDAHGLPVEVVAVGNCPMDERLAALVQAAREAMVNAARHSGAAAVSVYVEVEPDQAAVFVRDRGQSFEPDAVPAERLGLRESVLGRTARHGGRAEVRSAPGEGMEVRITVPRCAA